MRGIRSRHAATIIPPKRTAGRPHWQNPDGRRAAATAGRLAALAMIVAEVMGVGIFLTPAGMARTLGATGWVLGVWALVGLLSAAGAVCYAELGSRYPEAGGAYVFLREAFGARCAFVYGWMSLLVMDPGLTAALGVGLAQYLLVLFGGPASLVPGVAIVAIVVVSGLTLLGVGAARAFSAGRPRRSSPRSRSSLAPWQCRVAKS